MTNRAHHQHRRSVVATVATMASGGTGATGATSARSRSVPRVAASAIARRYAAGPRPKSRARIEQSFRNQSVELRGFELLTFCMPSMGVCERTSEKHLWARGYRSLKFAKVHPGSPLLLHSVAAPLLPDGARPFSLPLDRPRVSDARGTSDHSVSVA